MKKKTILAGIATIAASLLLSGCGGPTGKVPGDSEVKKYVKENISSLKLEDKSRENIWTKTQEDVWEIM